MPVFYIGAYLLGSIPFGLLVSKARGVDIREVGSGNIGATNVGRALGKKYAILVFILDALKGFVPVAVAACWFTDDNTPHLAWHLSALALLPVIGHVFPVWLGFRGGKGVATSAGALAALLPLPAVIAAAVWGIVFFSLRYVSVASIAAAVSLPVSTWLLKPELPYLILTAGIMILGIIRHRSNIAALKAGTEHRFSRK